MYVELKWYCTGCERFSNYRGYGKSFEWDGDYVDETPSDNEGRKYCTVVAIDALFLSRNPKEQFSPAKVNRELNKVNETSWFLFIDKSYIFHFSFRHMPDFHGEVEKRRKTCALLPLETGAVAFTKAMPNWNRYYS